MVSTQYYIIRSVKYIYMPSEYITSIGFSKLTTLASSVIMDPKIMDRSYSYIVQSAENNRNNIFGSSKT